jgi:hypothetical protein
MNKHSKLTLVALALFFSALMSAAANAQSAPAPDYVRPPVSEATTPPPPKVALSQFWAISQGTAIVHYTAPNGVGFSEWIMYVTEGTE